MVFLSQYKIAFYVIIILLSNLFNACDPIPPREIENTDARVLPPIPQVELDFELIPEMDMEIPGPLLNSVLPNRSPLAGGIRLRIIGESFRAPMYVRLGEQRCLDLVVESNSRLTCTVPAVETPQSVAVSVAWGPIPNQDPIPDESIEEFEGGLRTLNEALTYYEPLSVDSLEPNIGPSTGQSEITIIGQGFSETTDVRFGGLPALGITVESTQVLKVLTPAHPPEVVDVSIRDPAGAVLLEDAYTFQVPLGLNEIRPSWGSVSGGESIQLYGYGFTSESQVSLAGQNLEIEAVTPPARISAITAPYLEPGWVNITIQNSNGEYQKDRAFLYLADELGPFEVYGAIPNQLPSDRGGEFMIGGNGFDENTRVTMEGNELNCQLVTAQRLNCFAPRRAAGDVQVIVWQDLLNKRFTLSYFNPLELFFVEPDRAAQCGGALIHVRGRGFTPETQFYLGDQLASISRYVSDEELWFEAPAHPPALVDITVRERDQEVYQPESFNYFDPMALYGGSWGERIENAVNVTVLNIYDFSPISEVRVEARVFDEVASIPLQSGLTNEDGQVTLSLEELDPPLHLNIAKSGFEVQTVERVVSENLTVLLFPFTPPEGESEPPPPPEPVTIQGMLSGLSELEKPPEPGMVLRAFVDVSHSGMLNRSVNPTPAPIGILAEDGPFHIITRPGQMALIATAAYVSASELARYERGEVSYWFMRKSTYPIKMGIIRFLSLSPGAEINGLSLNLDHDLNQIADVRLLNPPSGAGTIYTDSFGEVLSVEDEFEVRAFLDLEGDGYWELDVQGLSTLPTMNLSALPKLDEWSDAPSLLWFARSRVHPNGVNSYAEHQQSNLNQSVEIGPFVEAARLIERASGDSIATGETIRWEPWPGVEGRPTEPAQATTIRFYQAGLPVWGFTLPGGINELSIPPLPPSESGAGASPGSIYVSIEPMISAQGLDYQDYNLLDINNASSFSTTRFEIMYDP